MGREPAPLPGAATPIGFVLLGFVLRADLSRPIRHAAPALDRVVAFLDRRDTEIIGFSLLASFCPRARSRPGRIDDSPKLKRHERSLGRGRHDARMASPLALAQCSSFVLAQGTRPGKRPLDSRSIFR